MAIVNTPGSFISSWSKFAAVLFILLGVSAQLAAAFGPIDGGVFRRVEAAGSGCSPEGQWNCMTTSWQRCASGVWSVEMQMAAGTRCAPSGFTEDFRTEHDGTVNGEGGTGDGGGRGVGIGPRRSVSRALVVALSVVWLFQGFLS
jgi:hypothetical protein